MAAGRNCSADTLFALRRPCVAVPDRHPLRGVVGPCECPCASKEPFFFSFANASCPAWPPVCVCGCAFPHHGYATCIQFQHRSAPLTCLTACLCMCVCVLPQVLDTLHAKVRLGACAQWVVTCSHAVRCICSQVHLKWCYEGCGQCSGVGAGFRGQCLCTDAGHGSNAKVRRVVSAL